MCRPDGAQHCRVRQELRERPEQQRLQQRRLSPGGGERVHEPVQRAGRLRRGLGVLCILLWWRARGAKP